MSTFRDRRTSSLRQKGCTLWLTGLPASGKSTLALAVERALLTRGNLPYVLDGDQIRQGLNQDLSFSATDRAENIRRIGEVSRLFSDCGIITLVSFISPYREGRAAARKLHADDGLAFVEIYLSTPIAICEQRDPKGLYQKARRGEIRHFTGIDAPYEAPISCELTIDTTHLSPDKASHHVLTFLFQQKLIA